MKEERTSKETLKEKYEDSLFEVLMDEFAEKEGQRLIDENERLKNDIDFKLPKGFEARCEKTISNAIAAKNRKDKGQIVLKGLGKVAIFVAVFGIIFTVLFNSVSAFRVSIWSFLTQEDASNTNITIGEAGEQTNKNDSIAIPSGSYLPTWVPNGFLQTSYSNTENVVTAIYTNNEEGQIYYYELGNNQVLGVNTNNSYNTESIEINGFKGLLVSRDDEISITWVDDKRGVLVRIRTTDIDKEIVIKIAESVKKN